MFRQHSRANSNCLDQIQTNRAFGKDITNRCQGPITNHLLKSMANQTIKTIKQTQQLQNCIKRDPIHDYHTQIVAYIQSYKKTGEVMQQEASQVTDKMRQILIDWLVDVHQSFELKEETLFLAFSYLDQYQHKKTIRKEQYQLVGITCLWMASKYQEIYPPRMRNFVQVTANTYNANQLKEMEGKIIQTLNFQLNRVTPLALLRAVELNESVQGKNLSMSKYLIELSHLSGKLPNKYQNKILIFSAMKLSDKICQNQSNLSILGPISNEQIYPCYKQMCLLLQVDNKYKLTSIKRKYNKQKYHFVGKIRLEV